MAEEKEEKGGIFDDLFNKGKDSAAVDAGDMADDASSTPDVNSVEAADESSSSIDVPSTETKTNPDSGMPERQDKDLSGNESLGNESEGVAGDAFDPPPDHEQIPVDVSGGQGDSEVPPTVVHGESAVSGGDENPSDVEDVDPDKMDHYENVKAELESIAQDKGVPHTEDDGESANETVDSSSLTNEQVNEFESKHSQNVGDGMEGEDDRSDGKNAFQGELDEFSDRIPKSDESDFGEHRKDAVMSKEEVDALIAEVEKMLKEQKDITRNRVEMDRRIEDLDNQILQRHERIEKHLVAQALHDDEVRQKLRNTKLGNNARSVEEDASYREDDPTST